MMIRVYRILYMHECRARFLLYVRFVQVIEAQWCPAAWHYEFGAQCCSLTAVHSPIATALDQVSQLLSQSHIYYYTALFIEISCCCVHIWVNFVLIFDRCFMPGAGLWRWKAFGRRDACMYRQALM